MTLTIFLLLGEHMAQEVGTNYPGPGPGQTVWAGLGFELAAV